MWLWSKAMFSMTKSTTEANFSRGPPFIPLCQSLMASRHWGRLGGGWEEAKHADCGTRLKTCASTPNWIKGTSRGAPIRDASLLKRCKAHEAGDKTPQSSYFSTDTYSLHSDTLAPSHTHTHTQQRPPSLSQGRLPFSLISIDTKLLCVCLVFIRCLWTVFNAKEMLTSS